MDPLSIAASIVGLLAAASKVSSLITVIIGRAKEARRQAENVLREVNDIRLCLAQLQIFLSESTVASGSHAKLVMVDQIMVVLTACVITFSELEEVVTTLQVDQPLRVPMKVRWAMKEQEVLRLLSRLQNSKASLNFMSTALTW